LDGELWLGRGRFDAISALVRRQNSPEAAWQAVRYMLFEWPNGTGPFEARSEQLRRWVSQHAHPALVAVPQRRVDSAAALARWLDDVVANGGEGLMLHRADAPYLTGRQAILAKFKPVYDAEAVVLAHLPGRGRLNGRLGALQVRNDGGQVFAIGTGLTDAQRASPPPIGSRITYSWRGLTGRGLPRFASLLRVRPPGE